VSLDGFCCCCSRKQGLKLWLLSTEAHCTVLLLLLFCTVLYP